MAPKEKYVKKTNAQILAGINQKASMSSTLNAGNTRLEQPELKNKKVRPKIMKKAEMDLPLISEIEKPKLEEVRKAQEQAGAMRVTTSYKNGRRMRRANEKKERQDRLANKRNNLNINLTEGDIEGTIENFKTMDAAELMFMNSAQRPDETLVEHYVDLQAQFMCIDEYEEQLNERIKLGKDEDAENLAAEMAQLNTLKDVRSFYQIHEELMANKYYFMLPRDHMLSMSYKDLRTHLDELYAKKEADRDLSLIDFYQNLIRLKQLGITDEKSIRERKEKYLNELTRGEEIDDRDGTKEMKKIAEGYKSFLADLEEKKDFYTEKERKEYIAQFMDTHRGDIEKFKGDANKSDSDHTKLLADFQKYVDDLKKVADEEDKEAEENKEAEEQSASKIVEDSIEVKQGKLEKRSEPLQGVTISPEQQVAMKRVGAYLLRRSCLESKKYAAFVHHFLQAPPEQQLVAYYLLENDIQDAFMSSAFYEAISDYKPNLKAIKKNIKTKTFSSAPDWKAVTNAVQAAKGLSGEMKQFSEYQEKIKELDATVKIDKEGNTDAKTQGAHLLENIAYRYGMLAQLYRNAGLHPDMSPDMVPDVKLRARLYRELAAIGKMAGELEEITKNNADLDIQQEDKEKNGRTDKYKEKQDKTVAAHIQEKGGKLNKILSYPLAPYRSLGLWYTTKNGWGKDFLSIGAVGYIGNSLSAVSAIIGGYSAIYGMTKLWGNKDITIVDKYTGWVSGVSGTIGAASGTTFSVRNMLAVGNVMDSKGATFTTMGSITGGIGLAVSCVSGVVSGYQLGKVYSSGKDIRLAKEKMNARADNPIFTEKKTLLRFFDHSEREISRQKASKYVNLAKSGAGIFVATAGLVPVLTPIAAAVSLISFVGGAVYDHCDKNRRKGVIKKAVDDQLGLDGVITALKDKHKNKAKFATMDQEKLREMARDEAVARFGYSSYKTYFIEVCREFAELLYRKLFKEPDEDAEGREMYLKAIMSLGLKVTLPDKEKGISAQPTEKAIIAKLMGG